MLPVSRVHELDMTVDEALKYIISMGVVAPKPQPPLRVSDAPRRPLSTTEIDRAGRQRGPRVRAAIAPPAPPNQETLRLAAACCQLPENLLKRTDYCGLIDRKRLGKIVTVCGWVHRRRDHGGVIFIDLRDREGLVQIVCDPDRATTFASAETLRNEYVVAVRAECARDPKAP